MSSSPGRDLASESHRPEPPWPAHDPALAPRPVLLIVAEIGSCDLAAAARDAGGAFLVVVCQDDGQQPMDFAGRVIRRILALEQDRRTVGRTILLLGPGRDAEVAAARRLVARALTTHAVTAQGTPLDVEIVRERAAIALAPPPTGG